MLQAGKEKLKEAVKRAYDTRIKCVEMVVITLAAAMIVILEKDMFFETRHVGKLLAARYGETNVASVGKSPESLTFGR